jgi:hypothetical protein
MEDTGLFGSWGTNSHCQLGSLEGRHGHCPLPIRTELWPLDPTCPGLQAAATCEFPDWDIDSVCVRCHGSCLNELTVILVPEPGLWVGLFSGHPPAAMHSEACLTLQALRLCPCLSSQLWPPGYFKSIMAHIQLSAWPSAPWATAPVPLQFRGPHPAFVVLPWEGEAQTKLRLFLSLSFDN